MLGKFKNIAISGDISTGKSTLARKLSKKLGWEYLSGGAHIREWFKENNIDVNNADLVPEEVDKKLDFGYQEKMKTEENVVFESHLAGWLGKDLPETFKVLCVADFETRMQRASKRDGVSVDVAKDNAKKRAGLLVEKFNHLYGVTNGFDPSYFNLIVDTTNLSPDEVLEEVLSEMEKSD